MGVFKCSTGVGECAFEEVEAGVGFQPFRVMIHLDFLTTVRIRITQSAFRTRIPGPQYRPTESDFPGKRPTPRGIGGSAWVRAIIRRVWGTIFEILM